MIVRKKVLPAFRMGVIDADAACSADPAWKHDKRIKLVKTGYNQ